MTPTARAEPKRGTLRIYLGAAPGVGKTFAMLNEGHRRRERGTDVVVGFVETHGRAADRRADRRPRGRCPAARSSTAAATFDGDGRRRHPAPPARAGARRRVRPHQRARARATRSAGRTSTSCSTPASTSSRPSTSSTSSRSTTSSSGSPASASARRCPTTSCAPPTRSSSSTWRPRRCAGGWPTATSTPPTRSTPRSATTSGPATCRRCASWRCCGSPTGSTTRCTTTASATASPGRGRRASGSSSPSSGAPGGDHLIRRAARIAQRAKGELIGVHVVADTGLAAGRRRRRPTAIAAQRRLLEELGGEYRRVTEQRRRRRAGRGGPVRERHPDRARRQRPLALARAGQRLGHQPGRPAVGADRRARHLPPPARPTRTDGERRLPVVKPVLTPLSPRRQLWGWVDRRRRPAADHASRSPTPATRSGCPACCCSTSCWRWSSPSSAGCSRPSSPSIGGFLLANWYFTPPLLPAHDRRGREPARPRRLRRRRRHRRRARRPGRAQPAAGAPGSQAEAEALAALAGAMARPGSLAEMLGQLRVDVRVPRRPPCSQPRRRRLARSQVASGVDPPADPDAGRRQPRPRRRRRARPRRRRRCRPRTSGCSTPSPPRSPPPPSASACRARPARPTELAAANDAARLRCCRRCRTTCARRWRRSRRRSPACASATSTGRPTTVAEFEATIEAETDRLTDARRQPARHEPAAGVGAAPSTLRPTGVEEVVLAAVASLGAAGRDVDVDVPETLPDVVADAALLERALANLDRQRRPARRRRTHRRGSTAGEVVARRRPRVDIRVIDRGPGHPRRPTASSCSSRSSGSATTGPTAPASASGWRSPAASSRRWAASWRSRTRPAAATTMVVGLPVAERPAPEPVDDAGAGRRRRGADPPGAGRQPARPAATTSTSPRRASRRSSWPPATTPTSSCSTSGCRASTGWR